jgi:hypothetical protein
LPLIGLITPVLSASVYSPVARAFLDLHYDLAGPQFNRDFKLAVKRNDLQTVSDTLNGWFAKNLDSVTLIDSAIIARQRGLMRMARLIEKSDGYRSTLTVTKWWRRFARWFKKLGKKMGGGARNKTLAVYPDQIDQSTRAGYGRHEP